MRSCPVVMIVVYDTRKRAPASVGDFLGIMSLGCVMQNMWLTAETLGVGMQIMSVFSSQQVETELRKILSIPDYIDIAFACRLGYPRLHRIGTCVFAVRFNASRITTRIQRTSKCETTQRSMPGFRPPTELDHPEVRGHRLDGIPVHGASYQLGTAASPVRPRRVRQSKLRDEDDLASGVPLLELRVGRSNLVERVGRSDGTAIVPLAARSAISASTSGWLPLRYLCPDRSLLCELERDDGVDPAPFGAEFKSRSHTM